MPWYKRRRMRCVFLHYSTSFLVTKRSIAHNMQFSIFKHIRILPGVRGLSSSSNSGQGYIPRGKGTEMIKGSATPGGGPVKQPDGGSNGGGQTNTSGGSATPGGRAM
ncbi:hypothetical protein EV421DRAFT_496414 [Armillaria borealis]|uniref:Uncharacterized protein n=1 Tax=Armillaria borealis TaxID=47425 RepID=A0AA39MRA5_9AGAR|nr:hypothetical protein EV421DRAFT_496414 [Armillaria borealis]